MPGHNRFQSIAVVREIESPENPSGLEKRVSVVPQDIGTLLQTGADVYVEEGAGLGVGFSDEEYVCLEPAIRQQYKRLSIG